MSAPKLGQKAKDTITGFEGTVTARVEYLTGSERLELTPAAWGSDYKDPHWFDAARLEVVVPTEAPPVEVPL